MNRSALKNYAPQARRAFIQAITDRAAYYGLTTNKIEPVVQKGDVAVVGGRDHPRAVAGKRKQLEERIKRYGFGPTMEAIAYTWFNRLVAIRFMELHGYLEHGFRVLSHPEGKPTPEILEQAEHVFLPGLKHDVVIDLKLAGNKEGELYRLLLTAQCNALHAAMPFLFERIDDETELLLPDNLLHSDSLIRKLVGEIDEQDWQQVEIIGWLYQFYISEKKDEVIGKVVASEDIPAATQLFTPNWIVKYLVQNTLGRQWMATYPQSALRLQMEYYIEPAEQTPEVQDELKQITPTSLNPEELTLLDPACGSGHILVEAYDLLKSIYQERGYRAKDIPALILQKNLFGLEIDDRAAQLAAFALMMKARADDRRIFDSYAKPNILAFQDSRGMNASEITHALNAPINKDDVPSEYLFEEIQEDKDGLFSNKILAEKGHVSQIDIAHLLGLFENAKTFGSLIEVPLTLASRLPEIKRRFDEVSEHGNLTHASAKVAGPLLEQCRLLLRQYNAVVANPPYMGTGYFNPTLKKLVETSFSGASGDLYAAFALRGLDLLTSTGMLAFITIPTWLFLPAYEELRKHILTRRTIECLIDNGRGVFGPDFGSCQFIIRSAHVHGYRGQFAGLRANTGSVPSLEELESRFHKAPLQLRAPEDFLVVPGYSISPYVPEQVLGLFKDHPSLESSAAVRQGIKTGDIDFFLRYWHEVSFENIYFDCKTREEAQKDERRWYPCNKGGEFCRWFGNLDYVINWQHDGYDICHFFGANGRLRSRPQNLSYFFKPGITWSTVVTMGKASFRISPSGRAFESGGSTIFPNQESDISYILGVLNSSIAGLLIEVLSPKISLGEGAVSKMPIPRIREDERLLVEKDVEGLVGLHEKEWASAESVYGFDKHPFLAESSRTAKEAWLQVSADKSADISQAIQAEQHLNDTLRTALNLERVVECEITRKHIMLSEPDLRREVQGFISYAVGCMMGRYSLDNPGLIYAKSGNREFSPSQYQIYKADDDGILPLMERDWHIQGDVTNRFSEFVGTVWPKEAVEENLKFVADALGSGSNELARDTIRRYLANSFYKHHLSDAMYKRRPIYWLFSSGKQRAFQCLVYLHRYHESTLARMRTEYVIPLQGQITARIEQLEGDKAAANSSSHRKKLQKEQDILKKQQAELLIFDEKLKHVADQRSTLDLDDGVKVNYSKFGDLLAESQAITGGKDDE